MTAPAQKIYFTVMESTPTTPRQTHTACTQEHRIHRAHTECSVGIFAGGKKVHQRYDLKGSTQGRTVGGESISKPGASMRLVARWIGELTPM